MSFPFTLGPAFFDIRQVHRCIAIVLDLAVSKIRSAYIGRCVDKQLFKLLYVAKCSLSFYMYKSFSLLKLLELASDLLGLVNVLWKSVFRLFYVQLILDLQGLIQAHFV